MRLTQLREFDDLETANRWLRDMARREVEVTVHDVKWQWVEGHEEGGRDDLLLTCSAEIEMDSDNMEHFVGVANLDDDEDDDVGARRAEGKALVRPEVHA